jgi:hypothetical protein
MVESKKNNLIMQKTATIIPYQQNYKKDSLWKIIMQIIFEKTLL